MGFIAEVHLVHDDLPLVPTTERRPGTRLRYEYEASADDRRLLFVSAFDDDLAAVEDAMDADPTVSDPTRIATFDHRTIYRLDVETDLHIVPDRCAADGLFVFSIASADGEWTVRASLPDRDALTAFRTWCRDRDVSFRVAQLYDSTVSDDTTYFLTERQREVLTTAYAAGYYDVPRAITQDELAERLDVSDSAVSQRLRCAVSELIAATIANGHDPNRYA